MQCVLQLRCLFCVFIYCLDLDEKRLQAAKEMGADAVVKVSSKDPKVITEQVKACFGGERPDVTLECSGAPPSIRTAIYVRKYRCCFHLCVQNC